MAMLTLTTILFAQVIALTSSSLPATNNGTYTYKDIQFECVDSVAVITIINPSAPPSALEEGGHPRHPWPPCVPMRSHGPRPHLKCARTSACGCAGLQRRSSPRHTARPSLAASSVLLPLDVSYR